MFGIRSCLVLVAALLVAGCGGSYYKVTDPATGNEYYTEKVNERGSGAVTIKDAATGDNVTLQNSHVTEVSKEEFETNRAGKR
jgi:hypothetical protein